jgi:hypothetical protein
MKKIIKIFVSLCIVIAGVLTVSYLQYRFDRSDLKHAVQAVREIRPSGPEGDTLEAEVARVYGVSKEAIQWVPEIESKTQGKVWVRAVLSGRDTELLWQVDLVRFSVIPISPAAKSLGKGSI